MSNQIQMIRFSEFRKLERALDESHRSQMQSMRAWQSDGGEA